MILVQNVLPEALALALREEFIKGVFKTREQTIERHGEETYTSRVGKSKGVRSTNAYCDAAAALKKVLNSKGFTGEYTSMAVSMTAGDYLRQHTDPGIGTVLYLSKGWQWDWGGLLLTKEGEKDSYTVVPPRFNQLMIMDKPELHFVTPVATYAKEPRYVMIGLMRDR